jgi:hypothetical protein
MARKGNKDVGSGLRGRIVEVSQAKPLLRFENAPRYIILPELTAFGTSSPTSLEPAFQVASL